MQKSGARFSKLKLVYKKAIQEMLSINIEPSESIDSFYNTTVNSTNYKERIETLKCKLSELFKQKIKEYDLENKLNTLDSLIKDNQDVKDINDEDYIQEILESYIVEDKLQLIEFVNTRNEELKDDITHLEDKLKLLEDEYLVLSKECNNKERRINKLIDDMKNVY
ncbi:hypothetical protein AAJ76_4200011647 [Vairimorpha ceranae]|uniref:Uncharacterized protein n=1 Tax=Vairimorpha ceranae TaxID=40302 RepID=A0A0F9WDH8_9MICR|nr:hypothetical protein AAJ76_4200011647 [Vairimorpha ceranae]KKO74845.1 hypothetical protein AAJ76_4200011647 [Vairimorpha ceranae]